MNADLDRGLTGRQIVRSYVQDSLRSTGRRLRKNWTGYFFLLPFFLLFLSAGRRFQWGSSALRFYLLPLLP